MDVRALFRQAVVPEADAPYDRLSLKVFYRAVQADSVAAKNTGIVAPDTSGAPFPIVIFFGGVNVSAESYQWLAVELARQKLIVVTFNWVTDRLSGGVPGLTPGVDLKFLTPSTYGTGPSGAAIAPILAELQKMQTDSPLAGLLDLDRIVFGGHSAGGSIALTNCDSRYFPQAIAAFSYGAHAQGSTMLGFEPDTILPVASDKPFLILGGTQDGVITASANRYGKEMGDPVGPLQQTFDRAFGAERADRYLIILGGANHFSIAYPLDETTARSFLDQPATRNDAETRQLLTDLIIEFINTSVGRKIEPNKILSPELQTDERIAFFKQK